MAKTRKRSKPASESDEDLEMEQEEELEIEESEPLEALTTDVEGFPISEDDREGLINLLTQIFLRNSEVSVPCVADALIAQNVGLVLGPAEDEADDDNANMVYGLLSILEVNIVKEGTALKFTQSLIKYIMDRATKYALKDVAKQFEDILKTKIGFLINERMLHFPTQVVPQSFTSLRDDLHKMKKPYKHVLYIQKIRVPEEVKEKDTLLNDGQKKKKKIGKAEKKRAVVDALTKAEVVYDNAEDAELFKLEEGTAHHFDYPVHNDVEAGSKFHIIEKEGKKWLPYRRAVVMDTSRFNAFVEKMTTFAE